MSEGFKRFYGCSMSFVGYLGWCGVVAGFIVYVIAVFFGGFTVTGLWGFSE